MQQVPRIATPAVVLLVDDEPTTIRLLRQILKADGCEIVEAADGEEALTAYRAHKPDLIMLDIILPHRDGLDVLREIRKEDSSTGIIMLSALSSERITIDSLLSGADDYISKPFQLRAMRTRIQQVLDKTALRRENIRLQIALASANNRIRQLAEHYLPPGVMAEYMERAEPPALGGRRQIITVLFADLQGFTPLAETVSPDQLVEILNRYLQVVAGALARNGGTLDKFMGDGVMGFFNAPALQHDHADRAVRAARDIVFDCQQLFREGLELSVGIGVNTGEAVVGNVGTPQLMSYTAIGDTVNLAQRLQEMAGRNEVLTGPETRRSARATRSLESIGLRHARGRSEPINCYRLRLSDDMHDLESES